MSEESEKMELKEELEIARKKLGGIIIGMIIGGILGAFGIIMQIITESGQGGIESVILGVIVVVIFAAAGGSFVHICKYIWGFLISMTKGNKESAAFAFGFLFLFGAIPAVLGFIGPFVTIYRFVKLRKQIKILESDIAE